MTVTNSQFTNNEDGLEVGGNNNPDVNPNRVTVTDSQFTGNLDGVELDGDGNMVTLSKVTIRNHKEVGIEFDGDKNVVEATNVTISENDGGGILFDRNPEEAEVVEGLKALLLRRRSHSMICHQER